MMAQCRECGHGRNCINGRWCQLTGEYVEHARELKCEITLATKPKNQ